MKHHISGSRSTIRKKPKKTEISSVLRQSVQDNKQTPRVSVWRKIVQVTALTVFLCLCFSFYLFTLKGVPGAPSPRTIKAELEQPAKPFELSPERGRYAHVVAISEQQTYALSQELADVVYPDVGYHRGKFYSFFAPGISFLATPLYLIGKQFGLAQVFTFAISSLFATLTLLFLYKIARDIFAFPVWGALLAPLIFAFASTSWSYAITLYQHHATTFFIVSGFYAVWRFSQAKKSGVLWASYVWIAYGIAILIDYPNAALLLPVMVYFFLSAVTMINENTKIRFSLRPAFFLTALFFVAITFFHGYHNQTHFGSWKTVSGGILDYKYIKEQKILEKDNAEQYIAEIAKQKKPEGFFKEENVPGGLYELAIAPDKGIFFFSPIFILAILGISFLVTQLDLKSSILLSIVGTNVFLYSSFGDPWGGWAFGPRYLIPSMAILAIFVVFWLIKTRHMFWTRLLLFCLFAYSSGIALLGALTTNAVPPKVEADYLNMKYNFLLNFDVLRNGQSSSFLFNEYLSPYLSLFHYFIILYAALLCLVIFVLFIIPRPKAYEH